MGRLEIILYQNITTEETIILKIIIGIILIFTLLAFAIILTHIIPRRKHSVNKVTGEKNTDKDIHSVNHFCTHCRIGKESYLLDNHSEFCPYIDCLVNGKCSFFSPIEAVVKSDNKNKQKQ